MRHTIAGILAVGLLASGALGQATPSYNTLSSGAAVAGTVDAAVSEVLVASELLRSRALAEALRRAVIERGVRVYILALSATVNERSSFSQALALAGASVRLGSVPASRFVVVDRRIGVTGPLVGALEPQSGTMATVRSDDPRYVGQLVRAFVALFASAKVFQPRVGR